VENEWQAIGHFYEPIPLYAGQVLKYQGIATARNVEWMMAKPGMRLLPDFIADRIDAATLQPFTSF
jgi:hypothetical protein